MAEVSMNYEQIKFEYKTLDPAKSSDSFDFIGERDEDETAGLLLPAVQQVREPSTLPPDVEDQSVDSFKFGPAKDDSKVEAQDALLIINELSRASADSHDDKWIDVLSTDWGMEKPGSNAAVKEAGLRSDGELVQAVTEADMGGDFIL